MGGNGTFAAGNIAKYRWETVDSYNGVKVLRPVLPPGQKRISQKLPEEAHSSKMYMLLHESGKLSQLRLYDRHHLLRLEIAFHPETGLDPSRRPVLHYNTYSHSPFTHSRAHWLSDSMMREFGKYFKGLTEDEKRQHA